MVKVFFSSSWHAWNTYYREERGMVHNNYSDFGFSQMVMPWTNHLKGKRTDTFHSSKHVLKVKTQRERTVDRKWNGGIFCYLPAPHVEAMRIRGISQIETRGSSSVVVVDVSCTVQLRKWIIPSRRIINWLAHLLPTSSQINTSDLKIIWSKNIIYHVCFHKFLQRSELNMV